MATVIAVYNSDGLVGRCDAKCHDATEPTCTCICGGANHGGGYAKAVENSTEWMIQEAEANEQDDVATYLKESLERFRQNHGLNGELRVAFGEDGCDGLQPPLPLIEER